MRYLLLCFFPVLAFAQDKVYRVQKNNGDTLTLIRYPHSKTVNVTDGLVLKRTIPERDTAYFYNATDGEYEVITTFKKKGGVVVPPDPIVIEQIVDAEQATFSSNWTYHGSTTATGWLNNTISFSNVTGSTVTYTFTGRKIEVFGETLLNHGTGTVKVDNEPEVPVTYKSATKVLPAKIFEKSWPADGQHTITVKVGTGNSLVDYFRVTKAQ